MNYDVFISCKSEDYQYAEEIYNFLKESGITVFLASTELRRLGESEYRKAISSALKAAHHMIVFASKPEYIDARWVYYEWDMFVNAKLKGFKPGNIVTILNDVDTKEINMDLWKYESLRFDDYKKSLVSYVETPESKQRLEQIKIAQKEEAEKQRQEQARIEKQLKIKRELVALAEDFKKKLTNLSVDIAKIKEKKRAIGNVNYECPVCSEINSIVNENCEKCGWPFSPIEGIEGAEYLNKDRKTLIEKFKALRTAKCNTEQIDDLNNHIASLQASLDEVEKEKKELLESNKSLADEVIKLREEKSKSKKDNDTNGSASGGSSNPKLSVFKGIINWIKSLNKSFWGYLALALLFVIVFVFLDKHADSKDFDLECFEADSCSADTIVADSVVVGESIEYGYSGIDPRYGERLEIILEKVTNDNHVISGNLDTHEKLNRNSVYYAGSSTKDTIGLRLFVEGADYCWWTGRISNIIGDSVVITCVIDGSLVSRRVNPVEPRTTKWNHRGSLNFY